jgi:glycosyltransferase involved in cell wall biosynthesis
MLQQLLAIGLRVRLLLVGDAHDARDREALLAYADRLGVLSAVEVTGMLLRADAQARIATADVALSPIPPSPVFDVASPTKLVEYLALGIPVVANTHPEQRVVLRGSRGGVCVPWNARHFARGVRWLLAQSPTSRQAIATRGRSWVAQHRSYEVIADIVERRCCSELFGAGAARG